MKRMAWALALSTALAAPAFAADSTKNAASSQTQTVTQAHSGQWRASKLIGVSLYSAANESIGEVNDILIDRNGNIDAVVVGVGGFLGIGEKNVALSFKDVKWADQPLRTASANNANPPIAPVTPANPAAPMPQPAPTDVTGSVSTTVRDYPDHGVVSLTKDQLQAMPDFHYASEAK